MAIVSGSSKTFDRNVGTVDVNLLLDDESVDETTSDAIDVLTAESLTLLVDASAGVSGGVVTLEGALTSDYAGTWAAIGTATINAASKLFQIAPADLADFLPLPYVRARISTVISGGTVDIYLITRR